MWREEEKEFSDDAKIGMLSWMHILIPSTMDDDEEELR